MAGLTFEHGAAPTAGEKGQFKKQLNKVYGWYTGGFIAFIIVLAIAEQLGLPNRWIGYCFLFADRPDGTLAGYACYGRVPLTESSFDLYWIAVDPGGQRRGLGRWLLAECERRISAGGAAQVWVDTSGRDQYAPTRGFYERAGYQVAARFPDFYAPGDDKVVFVRRLEP